MNENKKHIILKTENLSIGYASKKAKTIVASNINIELQQSWGMIISIRITRRGLRILNILTHNINTLIPEIVIH